jgi:hypothetical protein
MGILGKGLILWVMAFQPALLFYCAVRNFEVMQGRGRSPVDITEISLLTRW